MGVMYEATIIVRSEVAPSLPSHLGIPSKLRQRADGSYEVAATLKEAALADIVSTGATVILHGIVEPGFPQDRIASQEQLWALLRELLPSPPKGR